MSANNKQEDFLEELMEEFTQEDPDLPLMVDALLHQRYMLRALGEERKKRGLAQEELAARVGISQDELDGLEHGETDPHLSTLSRLAAVLGMQLEVRLIPAQAEEAPSENAPGGAEGSTTSAIAG
jgi:ribosome-binding protein aMBF1 (putative translation factor)